MNEYVLKDIAEIVPDQCVGCIFESSNEGIDCLVLDKEDSTENGDDDFPYYSNDPYGEGTESFVCGADKIVVLVHRLTNTPVEPIEVRKHYE